MNLVICLHMGCIEQKACLGTGTAMKSGVEHITMLAGQVATGAVFQKKITVDLGQALWDQEAMNTVTRYHLAGKLVTGFAIGTFMFTLSSVYLFV